VSWRETVNRSLTSATGYRFVKAAAGPPSPGQKPKPARRKMRNYFDARAKETIRTVKPWTMTSYDRIFALVVAVRYVERHRIPGEVVECGVWRGGSMQAVALTLRECGSSDRDLHLFDTFEGMPPPTELDRRINGASAEELLESGERKWLVQARAGLDDVRDGMQRTGYPAERIHYHEGKVEDTIPAGAPEQIALLRLDTDWYESTRHELEHLYPRLAPGGVLIIDDYDYWEGSRRAVDEFLDATGARLLLVPVDTARVAVKP
jgi:O-methyltransferase